MRRAAVVAVLVALGGCRDFEGLLAQCRDGGPCAASGGGSGGEGGRTDAGGGAGGGLGGGGGGLGGGVGGGVGGAGGGGGATDGGDGGPVVIPDAGPFCPDDMRSTIVAPDGGWSSFCFNGFLWENPKPHGTALFAVYAGSATDVWAGGEAGMLMRWNGAYWTSHQDEIATYRSAVTPKDLGAIRALTGIGTTLLWAGGDDIAPWHYNGNWLPLVPRQDERIQQMAAVSLMGTPMVRAAGAGPTFAGPLSWTPTQSPGDTTTTTGLAIDAQGNCRSLGYNDQNGIAFVHDCEDGGLVYSANLGPISPQVTGTLFATGDGGFVIAGGTRLRRLDPDGGVTFGLMQANAPIVLVAPTSAGQLMAVDALGQIYRGTLDTLNPTNLAPVFVGKSAIPLAVSGFPNNGSWIVGLGGLTAREGAGQFTRTTLGPPYDFYGVDLGGGGYLAAGENSFTLREDGGASGGGSIDVYDLTRSSSGTVFGVGQTGAVRPMTATGVFQAGVTVGDGGDLRGIHAFSDTDIIVAGASGLFERRPDGGYAEVPGMVEVAWDVSGAGNTAFAVGELGQIAQRVNGTWTRLPDGPSTGLLGVWMSSPDAGWIVGGGGVVLSIDNATVTQLTNLPPAIRNDNLNDVWGFATDDVWAVGERGMVIHFNGTAWSFFESGTRNALEAVRGRTLPNGKREIFIVGQQGTILRKIY